MNINIGVIGCGKIAQIRHVPEYEANPNVTIKGFYDLDAERTKDLAKRYDACAYASFEELLANEGIDAVSICVANNAHASITIEALKAGKHVLCEKPMATTIEDCEAMVAAAKKYNRYLMIGQNQRLAKAHQKAKELIEQGVIGEVLTFRTTFGHSGPETWSVDSGKEVWFFDKNKAAMGAMADLGIHKTDVIQYIIGQKIVETQARLVTIDKRDANGDLISVDDNAICIYRMENGAFGTMTASWTYYGEEDNTTIIYGSKGILRLYDDPQYSVQLIAADGQKTEYEVDQIQTNDNQTASGVIDLFIDGLINDVEPAISGADVLHAMKVVFASIESSEKGTRIEIK